MLMSTTHIQEMLDATNRMLDNASAIQSAIYTSALAEVCGTAVRSVATHDLPALIEELQVQQNYLCKLLQRCDGKSVPADLVSIDALGLGSSEIKLLKRNNILYVSSLSSFLQFHSLRDLNGCGRITEKKIKEALQRYEMRKDTGDVLERDLIPIHGELYSYISYDEDTKLHKVSEVEIDEEGQLTCTYRSCFFTEEELKDNKIELTQKQWLGLVEHTIKEVTNCEDDFAEKAAEDIVFRCFKSHMPTVEQLPGYVAGYFFS